ncbi:helix-turn-helix domain-containing protein [Neobacillus drentensis]|uniref:helix-turn-helix domain-containing protein n=1 Tax=Neobacillus drentensis TaxID=220684 RepID=UPI002FFDF73D
MAKFTIEKKLEVVHKYLNNEGGYRFLSEIYGITKSTIEKWVLQFQYHGEKGLLNNYTNYTVQFKLDVLNYMNEQGTSLYETAAIFNIPAPSTILNWKLILETQGLDALKSNKKGRPSMKEDTKKSELKNPAPAEGSVEALQEKIKRLEMENAYLKKLNALVQMQEKLQTKSKRK